MKRTGQLSSPVKLVFHFLAIALFLSFSPEYPKLEVDGSSTDSLLGGYSLSLGQTLVSGDGFYEFGFFSYYGKSYYAGIRFAYLYEYDDSDENVVWVARPAPTLDPVLTLSENGDLVLEDLHDHSQFLIWSPNFSGNETVSLNLVLLDTGNLVLQDEKNSSRKFWQSFDHPIDTWLAEAPLGPNISLTSTGTSGTFSLQIDPNRTHGFIITQISHDATYYGAFPHWIEIREDGDHLLTLNGTNKPHLYVRLSSWQVSVRQWVDIYYGTQVLWSTGGSLCDFNSLCGPYASCNDSNVIPCSCPYGFEPISPRDWQNGIYKKGCSRSVPLSCETSKDSRYVDTFYSIDIVKMFPNNPQFLHLNTKADCENSCLNNCSCTAYSYTRRGCDLWFGELFHGSNKGGGDVINFRVRSMKSPLFRNKNRTSLIIIGCIMVLVVILIFGLICCWYRKMIFSNRSEVNDLLVLYSYARLKSITKNFSQKLGEGGFGIVFKGNLSNYNIVAVKKLKAVKYEEKQFRSEIQTIGVIQHVNLVRLFGFCAEGTKRLLVYEYMPNGSLNSYLFSNNSKKLFWETRYQIVLGIARGLAYLHEECRDCIIHCDIKPENILLDANFCPKIADFGMAKLLGRDFSRALTTMRGTIGYLAPEWISGQPITEKADVYSFGMMLFEIISGKRNTDIIKRRECPYFPLYAAMKINGGNVLCLLDEELDGHCNMQELDMACKVACWCIQDVEDHRPSMRLALQMLQGLVKIEMPPIPSSLQKFDYNENDSMYSYVD